jgi:hypothetical protein
MIGRLLKKMPKKEQLTALKTILAGDLFRRFPME